MSHVYTPLRYPGGKAKLGPFLAATFKANKLVDAAYAEPYAGGAGAALFLLFRGYASRIHLNDIDAAVVSFWRAVLNHNERFAKQIEKVPLTVREWDRQRAAYRSRGFSFDRGFAFFFLNRTNRSGIMNGGVIGGRDQSGKWKIDARFNRAQLADQIRAIGEMRRLVSVSRSDAVDFLDALPRPQSSRILTYLDPPYFGKGSALYMNSYTADDHADIAKRLQRFNQPWILTYDDCPEIRALYKDFRVLDSELSYSAREVRRGREIVVLSPGLRVPAIRLKPTKHTPGFKLLREAVSV